MPHAGRPPRAPLAGLSVVPVMLAPWRSRPLLVLLLCLVVGLALGAALGRALGPRPGDVRRPRALAGRAADQAEVMQGLDRLQRPDARPRPPAGRPGRASSTSRSRHAALHRRAAPRDPGAVHRAAQAAGPRPLGRAAPAPRGRAGRAGRPLRLHRAGPPATTAPSAPTWSCTWSAAAASWSTPRCRSTPTSTPPSTDDDEERAGAPAPARPPAAHARRPALRQGLLALAAGDARSSWCCSCPPSRSWPPRSRPTRALIEYAADAPGRAGHARPR